PASMECDTDSDSESDCDSESEPQSDSESESEPEPVRQLPPRRCSARLAAALAPAAPTGPPLPLDCEDPAMLRQLKDFCKFFANPNYRTCYNQLQRRLVRHRHPMLMPAFEDPNNQALLAKLHELGSINLAGDANTIDTHSMQLAPAKRTKRTKAEPAAEPTKGKGKGKAAKAKPAPQPGTRLDRDCNAALNMQRIGESKWRPLELCYWPDQGALPAKGKEYPGLGYKRLRDKPPKAQQQQQQPAEAQASALASSGGSRAANSRGSDGDSSTPSTIFISQDTLWAATTRNTLEEDMAELSMKRHGRAKQLVVFFGAACIGTAGGWGADAVLRACRKVVCRPRGTDQLQGRVVLVDEHRTTWVSSAVNGKQPCEVELNTLSATRPAGWKPPAGQVEQRLLWPAWSQQRDQPVRGMMWCPVVPPRKPPQAPRSSQEATPTGPSTPQPAKRSKRTKAEPAAEPTKGKGKGKAVKAKPAPQPGRWLDRDCNAALNMQRIGESKWRPLELCYWPDQGALPAKGKEYPGLGYKRLRDKPPKAQQQQQQPAEAQ
ncbi:hypothetical protein QJQ45_021110, partial [Haematococcus lacustris]